MPFRRLFIWVEGDDDQRIFEMLKTNLFVGRYDEINIIQYARRNETWVNRFLDSITSMEEAAYLFVCDIDDVRCITTKKAQIKKKFQRLDEDRILVVVKEIESWYVAGVAAEECAKLGLKYVPYTNSTTKEEFNQLIPKRFPSRIDFMIELLKCFSIEVAKPRNNSFGYFIQKHTG